MVVRHKYNGSPKKRIVNKGYGGISLKVMESMLFSILVTGFSVAFFHAAIPTHWLPFVMAARTQKWSRPKTLAVTALAGAGHVLLTTILGIAIVWLGIELDKSIGHYFPIVAGGALILFGLYYLVQYRRGKGHSHSHVSFGKRKNQGHHDHTHEHDHHHHEDDDGHDHDHQHSHSKILNFSAVTPEEMREAKIYQSLSGQTLGTQEKVMSDRVAIMSLIAMLTFSPCEGFLPVYLSGIGYGWGGFALLSAILAIATLAGMVTFTWLTLTGMERLRLSFLEKHESALMGILLCALGILVIILEH